MSRKYISSTQLGNWITEIKYIPSDKAKERFAEIYQTLYADTEDGDGFGYAGWGKGVVTKETITGVSRLTL